MPPRCVLVGTDGSVTATEAVRRAAVVTAAMRARLAIACIYSRSGEAPPTLGGGVLGQLASTAAAGETGAAAPLVGLGRPRSGTDQPEPGGSEPGDPTGAAPADGRWRITREAEAKEVVRRAARLARRMGVGSVETRVLAGDAAGTLIRLAAELPADMLVVGSKGMRSWTRFVLGNVPDTVARQAGCDVLIVRTD
jgi:nucleotide-binding universal stress UspA family protein